MKPAAFAFVILLLPCTVRSQSLCRAGEVDYFSCETTANQKIVSVCGNIANGEVNDDSWLQYRFGKKGAIELLYPAKTAGSIAKFEGNFFGRYNVIDLRFISGRTLYGVSLNQSYDGDEAQPRPYPSGGIIVHVNKIKHVNIGCRKVDASKYYQVFSDLNILLRDHNGDTDFLYQFYNQEPKQSQ